MAAIKTWVPNELLKSADLNTAFLTAAQGYMTGAFCGAGAVVSGVAANVTTDLPFLAPTTGNDQGGYYQATAGGRLVVPSGLDGLYQVSALIQCTGGTKGDLCQVFVPGAGMGANHHFARAGAGPAANWISWLAQLAAGATIYPQATPLTTGGDLQCVALRLIRLASFGLYR